MSFCGMDGFTKRLWEPGRHVIISYTVYTWLYRDYQAGRIKDMLITIQQVKSNKNRRFLDSGRQKEDGHEQDLTSGR